MINGSAVAFTVNYLIWLVYHAIEKLCAALPPLQTVNIG